MKSQEEFEEMCDLYKSIEYVIEDKITETHLNHLIGIANSHCRTESRNLCKLSSYALHIVHSLNYTFCKCCCKYKKEQSKIIDKRLCLCHMYEDAVCKCKDLLCVDCEIKRNDIIESEKSELLLESNGIFNFNFSNFFSRSTRNDNKEGFVYICHIKDDVYKIGVTGVSVWSRMNAQAFKKEQFVHALKTKFSFELEKKMHGIFYKKRQRGNGEMFELNKNDLDFIRNSKSINDTEIDHITLLSHGKL